MFFGIFMFEKVYNSVKYINSFFKNSTSCLMVFTTKKSTKARTKVLKSALGCANGFNTRFEATLFKRLTISILLIQ